MIQQDNIKEYEIAAFRAYGHIDSIEEPTFEDTMTLWAVSSVIRHLKFDDDDIALKGVQEVYCKLPMGHIRRGTITNSVKRTAFDMFISESTLWSALNRARRLFNKYYRSLLHQNQE